MLHVVNAEEALQIILETISGTEPKNSVLANSDSADTMSTDAETIALEDALFRQASEDIISPEDLPAFARSTVDGYAVAAEDTHGCSESIPAMLICDGEIKMGETPAAPLQKGHCIRISTGGNLPEGADAVSMIEYTDDIGDELRYIYKPVACLENVNNKGDDVRTGSVVLKKGTLIKAKHIAVLAALGISQVPVTKQDQTEKLSATRIESANQLKVGILSTGDELVDYTATPKGAQIRNINSVMLAGQVRELGAIPVVYPIIQDELALLTEAIQKALSECDVVLISGGSSVGEKDNTFRALQDLGTVHFHGISIKPGKPTMFATADEKPVFGLPGHPQAAYFIFRLFAAPAVCKMMGIEDAPAFKELLLSKNVPSNHGREEIVPVIISGQYAEPLHAKSGVISVLSAADGYIRVARDAEGLKKETAVKVFLL